MDYNKLCLKCMHETVSDGMCSFCHSSTDFDQDPAFALPLNAILHGRYLVGAVLGHGGFGITYIAYDLKENRRVAIKEYMPDGLSTRIPGTTEMTVHTNKDDYEYGLNKFLEEARIIYKYQHNPSIISVHALFEENRTAYYVMEYLEGCDLRTYISLKGGRLPWQEGIRLLLPVCDALRELHKQNIIHRDVSPDNIYICKNGNVKLLDFGAARMALGNKSQSLSIILKRGYAPEEQYRSHGNQGPHTDVYALAGTLYHTITGRTPPEAPQRVFRDELVPPSMYCPDLLPYVNMAILKALSVKAEDRFPDMASFKAALTNSLPVRTNQSESAYKAWSKDVQGSRPSEAADLGRRLGAALIDGLIIGFIFWFIILAVIGEVYLGTFFLLLYIFSIAYSGLLESSEMRATIGKRVMGIIVTDSAGQRLSLGKAVSRNALKFSGSLISMFAPALGGGVAVADAAVCLFSNEKLAGHDMLTKTRVLKAALAYTPGSLNHAVPVNGKRSPAITGILGSAGYYDGVFFPLTDKKVILGRNPASCNIIFPEGTIGVSRIHCEITLDASNNQVHLKDLGSSQGTFTKVCRLYKDQETVLSAGESFTIGENNTFEIIADKGAL